jgi:hypothetical protein
MTDIQLAHLSWGNDAANNRDRFHETALREARVASEYRQAEDAVAAPAASARFVTRLRLAFAGGSSATTEACNCPA